MTEQTARLRDLKLRRLILRTLANALISPRRGLNGSILRAEVEAIAPPGWAFEGESHAIRLINELANAELVNVQPLPRRRGQIDGLDYLFCSITDAGSQLVEERVGPHPMVDDDRVNWREE